MNINEEGKYYASMVRKFRTEYNSKNLHGFCSDQKVSYTKMLHCLRNDSYRKPSAKPACAPDFVTFSKYVCKCLIISGCFCCLGRRAKSRVK